MKTLEIKLNSILVAAALLFAPMNALAVNLDKDTDHDGVSDEQEILDGSSPTDRGSRLVVLSTTQCSEWNGFLDGMWNVFEHVNMGQSDIDITSTLYDIEGVPQSSYGISVPQGGQRDLLVHDMTGWTQNSYGKVCSSVHNGSPGDLDGRMVYYKPKPQTSPADNEFEFAIAMPLLEGVTGRQFVPFNSLQPSVNPQDAANLVANWIQLTNLGISVEEGELILYGQDGTELSREQVELAAGARRDFPAHGNGLSPVGVVEWRPDNSAAKFQLRNVRYYYDNPGHTNSFATAMQLQGLVGSGQELTVPLDTRTGSTILEVVNTLDQITEVDVALYDGAGTEKHSYRYELEPYESLHLITDAFLEDSRGIAVIQGDSDGSIAAVAMQYERDETGSLESIFGIAAEEPLGTTLRGSYNTYLNQSCRLVITNPTSSDAVVHVGMKRWDGTQILDNISLEVPANGLRDFPLCSYEAQNHYGVVTLQPETSNTVTANVIRVGNDNSYQFPTPVRQ